MKVLQIVLQIIMLFLFYYIGVWLQGALNLPIPGSIIGMLLLFILLLTKVLPISWFDSGASFLLSHLTLLFIPVTVGVIDFLPIFQGRGLLAVMVAFFSTVLVIVASGHVSQWAAKITEKSSKKNASDM